MGKLQEFINNLLWHVNRSIYLWGGQGEDLSKLTENKIRAMETTKTNANKAIALWKQRKGIAGARAFDCSGLGIYLLQCVGALPNGFDTTANGLKGMCKKLIKSQLKKGDFVFKTYPSGKAYHIGYIVNDNLDVVEAQGRAYGVVQRPLSAGGWNWFGRPSFLRNEIEAQTQVTAFTLSRILKKGKRGNDVAAVQSVLNQKGFNAGTADGIFGTKTLNAVKAFQKSTGLKVDGIVGKDTCSLLGGVWK